MPYFLGLAAAGWLTLPRKAARQRTRGNGEIRSCAGRLQAASWRGCERAPAGELCRPRDCARDRRDLLHADLLSDLRARTIRDVVLPRRPRGSDLPRLDRARAPPQWRGAAPPRA